MFHSFVTGKMPLKAASSTSLFSQCPFVAIFYSIGHKEPKPKTVKLSTYAYLFTLLPENQC